MPKPNLPLPLPILGAALIGAAILLSFLPGFYGPGLLWSVLTLALGVVAVLQQLRHHQQLQQQLRVEQVKLPPQVDQAWISPLFALVAAVLAWSIIGLKIVALLWLAGAACLVYDQWLRPATDPSGMHYWFNWRSLWRGYRRLMLLGMALMFVAMLLTFSKGSAGWFMGGYDTVYSSSAEGYVNQYNFTKYYMPGISSSTGRAQSFSTIIQLVMAGLLVWAGFRKRPGAPQWLGMAPVVGAGLTLAWWLISPKQGMGSWLYFIGLIPVCGAAYFLYQGQGSGKFDGSEWLDRLPWPVKAGAPSVVADPTAAAEMEDEHPEQL